MHLQEIKYTDIINIIIIINLVRFIIYVKIIHAYL